MDMIGHQCIRINSDEFEMTFSVVQGTDNEFAEPILEHVFVGNCSKQLPSIQSADRHKIEVALRVVEVLEPN